MKHKILLFLVIILIAIGSSVLADYIEPTVAAPGNNTPNTILKTGPANQVVTTVEKIGVGDGTNQPSQSLLKNGGSFISLGGGSDKFVTIGASKVNAIPTSQTKSPNDFFIKGDSSSFDQYINNSTVKPLEAFIAGRYISKLAITGKEDDPADVTQRAYNPAYDLDLQATSPANGDFNPTTNIGLGNTCNLYPGDMGNSLDIGGCPQGSYMTMYKSPTWSGTLSSTNNNTNMMIAQCTYFNPSSNPTNTGDCYPYVGTTQTQGKNYIMGSRVSTSATATSDQKRWAFPANTRSRETAPGSGIMQEELMVFSYEFKNPKITFIETNGATVVKQVGPTATDYMNTTMTLGNNRQWIITDDYGQYYSWSGMGATNGIDTSDYDSYYGHRWNNTRGNWD